MSGSMFNIEKLDESNYDAWNLQVKSVLIHQDLWSFVSDGNKPEDKPENQDALAAWKAKDEKAMATIVLSITPMQIAYIKNCATAKVAWNTLSEVHRPKGPVRKVTLFKQLLSMRMEDDECMQRYVCTFTSVVEKLAEIGVALHDELFVIMLLASLPKSYEPLVVALESRDQLPTLPMLKIKLIEEGERKKANNNKKEEESVQAFIARDFNANKNRKGNSSEKHNMKNVKCFNCKRKGHYAASCKETKKDEQRGQQNNKKNSLFSVISNSDLNSNVWCIDSGASSHLCCNRDMFVKLEEHNEKIMLAGENCMVAKGIGTVRLKLGMGDITLVNVLFVPGLQCNFMSVSKAVKYGNTVVFGDKGVQVKDMHGDIILRAQKVRDLFLFKPNDEKLFFSRKLADEAMKWHCRYGHLNFGSIKELSEKKLVRGMSISIPQNMQCFICLKNKCTQKPFSNSDSRANEILEIVHTDVCGPMSNISIGGAKYLLTFIDDKSRYVFVYFLKNKDEVFNKFKEFQTMVERQTNMKIKVLRSDNGKEFVNKAFDNYLKDKGIVRQLSVPYTPQQNGVAERFNRTLIEMARCMLATSNLGEHLWAEAVNTAAYLRNRAPTRALNGTTPYEMFYNEKPYVGHLRIFGSAVVALDKRQKSKFGARGKEFIMIGYSDTSKAYRLYNQDTKQLIVSRDVYFVEQSENQWVTKQDHQSAVNINVLPAIESEIVSETMSIDAEDESDFEGFESAEDDSTSHVEQDVEVQEVISSENEVGRGRGRPRITRSGAPGRPRKEYNVLSLACSNANIRIPQTVDEALNSENSHEWWNAMQIEYDTLLMNGTWELTELPIGQKAISNKWVFTIKRNEKNEIERFKARLVAKGCAQKYGINYLETFSPVVRHETLRMIFAIAAEYELNLHQMDVSSAYLNGELETEVYMDQPREFVDRKDPHKVLKLKKALYGLKQSGRQWNLRLDSILKEIGFQQCDSEPCVYVKNNGKTINIIAVYVDDLLIAGSKMEDMVNIKAKIADKVKVVDKGAVKCFLSLEVNRDGDKVQISISQKSQIKSLLKTWQTS